MIKRIFKRLILIILLVVFLVWGIIPAGLAYFTVYGMVNGGCNNGTPLNERLPAAQAIIISPESGLALKGWYVPGTNGAGIIVLPGAHGGASSMEDEMIFLHEAGYSVLSYETRNCEGEKTTLGAVEQKDMQAAITYLSQQPEVDPEHIGALGFSMGGATVILTAAKDDRLKAVIAMGNYRRFLHNFQPEDSVKPSSLAGVWENWLRWLLRRSFELQTGVDLDKELNPIDVIDQISPRAIFVIHGSKEIGFTKGDEQYERAGDPKQLWIVPDAGHGGYANAAPDEYAPRIIEFFDTYLLIDHEQ